jgi:hypothetical protein
MATFIVNQAAVTVGCETIIEKNNRCYLYLCQKINNANLDPPNDRCLAFVSGHAEPGTHWTTIQAKKKSRQRKDQRQPPQYSSTSFWCFIEYVERISGGVFGY